MEDIMDIKLQAEKSALFQVGDAGYVPDTQLRAPSSKYCPVAAEVKPSVNMHMTKRPTR